MLYIKSVFPTLHLSTYHWDSAYHLYYYFLNVFLEAISFFYTKMYTPVHKWKRSAHK